MPAGITYFRGTKNRLTWPEWKVRVVNGTGSNRVAGDFMRFNTLFSDGTAVAPTADPTQFDERVGVKEGIFGTTAKFVAAGSFDHEACVIGCVCAEDILAGQEGWAYVSGIVDVKVTGTGAAASTQIDAGVPLSTTLSLGAAGDGEALGAALQATVNVKALGILVEQYVSGGSGELILKALMSPIYGFGASG